MRNQHQSRLSLVSLALLALTAAASGETYSWHSSSGLFPDQVDPSMISFGGSRDIRPEGLRVDSRGPDLSYYEQSGENIVVPGTFILRTNVRVIQNLTEYSEIRSHAMFNVNLVPGGGGIGATFGIGTDEVYYMGEGSSGRIGSAAVDTDDNYHDYRVEANTVTGDFQFFQDDVAIMSGIMPGLSYSTANIWFGDGTQYAGGLTYWRSFEHNAAAVPEPSSLAAIGLGIAAVIRRRIGARKSALQ